MNIIVRSHRVPVSTALQLHCMDRVSRAVYPFRGHVERVDVVFIDLNGPKKGLGQACRIFVELTAGGTVMLQSCARDYYSAASNAAFRVGRHLARTLDKARKHNHPRIEPRIEPHFEPLGVA